jgi:putative DNA primase/helicase
VRLFNKKLNISPEVETGNLLADGTFKGVIAGDRMKAEEKHKPSFMFHPTAKWMVLANELPPSRDKSHGLFRRMLILKFDRQVALSEQDKSLPDRIIATELSGVLNWAIRGLARLRQQGTFTRPASADTELEKYKLKVVPALRFCQEEIMQVPGQSVMLREIYSRYREWCDETGHERARDSALSDVVQKHYDVTVTHPQRKLKFHGIALVDPGNRFRVCGDRSRYESD